MNGLSSEVRDVARRLVASRLAGVDGQDEVARRAQALLRRLDELMSALVGTAGFRAVMSRARHLSRPQCSWVAATELGEDGEIAVAAIVEAVARGGVDEVARYLELLVAHVLELLGSFIGHDLTLRIVRSGWRDVFENGERGEP